MGKYYIAVILPSLILLGYTLIQYGYAVRNKNKNNYTQYEKHKGSTKLVMHMALTSSILGILITGVLAYAAIKVGTINMPKNPLTVTVHYVTFVLVYNALMDILYKGVVLVHVYNQARKLRK